MGDFVATRTPCRLIFSDKPLVSDALSATLSATGRQRS
jgi:hypothetical protein